MFYYKLEETDRIPLSFAFIPVWMILHGFLSEPLEEVCLFALSDRFQLLSLHLYICPHTCSDCFRAQKNTTDDFFPSGLGK